MNLVRRFLLTCFFPLLLCTAPASAQYMYLDTNGDGVNTPGDRIPFSEGGEFTNVDIWLDTTTNRDGTAATCTSSGEPLSISSYEICLSVVGGSVDWGTFTNHMPFSTSLGAQENVQTYYNGFIGGTTLPPGRYLLATIQVAWRFSGPNPPYSLEIVAAGPFLPGARTAFQSECNGQNGDGFLRLGTDWFDTAGLPFGQIDHAPIVVAPVSVTGVEGTEISVPVSASDPDGEAITSLTADFSGLPLGHGALFTTNPSNTSGTLTWTPGFMHAGTYTVTFTASNSASGSATTRLTVADLNRAPIANVGGPYFGVSASPVQLDGSGSSDPDGDVLTYAWSFGDGVTGTGSAPMHAYSAAGTYNVTLRVMDGGGLYDDDATTATIRNEISVVLLKRGKATLNLDSDGLLKLAIEEVEVPYTSVLVGTLRLSTDFPDPGTVAECAADPKRSRIGDMDGNGVPDLEVGFSGFCLRNLFQNAPNNATVNLVITGQFQSPSGPAPLRGVKVVTIKRDENNAPVLAEVTPNPFNPRAKLSFVTVRPGNASIQVFDIHGHTVRTLMPQQYLMPGVHEVTIDGLSDQGLRLSSGVYFYRVHCADGVLRGAFAVLK